MLLKFCADNLLEHIEELCVLLHCTDERCGQCGVRLSEVESRVSHLRNEHTKLEAVHRGMEEENARLGKKEAAEV